MNKREKLLAGMVLGSFLVLFVGVGLKRFFETPIKKEQQAIRALRVKLENADKVRKDYFNAEDQLKRVAQRSFGDSLDTASAASGELIVQAIAVVGLSETHFTRIATGPRRLRGASELGWTVQGRGPLNRVVDLLYLLETSPYIHRLENVAITAMEPVGEVKIRFTYLTLVMTPPPLYDPIELDATYDLAGSGRQLFQPMVARDLWRPYIPKPPAPPPKPEPDPTPPAVARDRPRGPDPAKIRIVSLSTWGGDPEVHVRHVDTNELTAYRQGDNLLGTEVVAVDYRPIPLPRNPTLRSDSRVILQFENEYWAVERGQTLAEKRKLDSDFWPVQEAGAVSRTESPE